MGTDIHGFIECRWDRWLDEDDREWFQAVDLSHLYNGRSYVSFGSLFGVRNTTSGRSPITEASQMTCQKRSSPPSGPGVTSCTASPGSPRRS
ncbi:hypothetical protein ACIODZ_07510 [[Kitasatospora] papulosa]|uniref:hypothetical protein n=1 Tax=[Kitasatospora] papulosa TaxID=1464011 RepID=UPI003811859E